MPGFYVSGHTFNFTGLSPSPTRPISGICPPGASAGPLKSSTKMKNTTAAVSYFYFSPFQLNEKKGMGLGSKGKLFP